MAFNPTLAQAGPGESDLVPFAQANERVLLKRKGVALSMKIANKRFKGKGFLFLTTLRMIFLKEGKLTAHKGWSSTEFPLATAYSSDGGGKPPDFHQPIFGANYLEGVTPPLLGAPYAFEAAATWQLTFSEGGCARFVKIFYLIHRAAKRSVEAAQSTAENIISTNGAAFVDPSDPCVIFLQQPVPQYTYEYTGQGYNQQPPPSTDPTPVQPPLYPPANPALNQNPYPSPTQLPYPPATQPMPYPPANQPHYPYPGYSQQPPPTNYPPNGPYPPGTYAPPNQAGNYPNQAGNYPNQAGNYPPVQSPYPPYGGYYGPTGPDPYQGQNDYRY